jgi:hypothetical protein
MIGDVQAFVSLILPATSNRSIVDLAARSWRFHWVDGTFLSMDHQNPGAERLASDQQKRRSMLRMGTPFSAQTRLSLPHMMQRESTTLAAIKLVIWWVSEIICSCLQPTINLARMDTIQSEMTFGVLDKHPLLDVILATLLQPRGRGWTTHWLSNCQFGGIQKW